MQTKKEKKNILSIVAIIGGALLAAFSVMCILIPNDAIDYGTAGVAIIINKLTGINLSICVALIFVPFWIAGYKTLGKQFAIRSIIGTATYTIGLEVFKVIPFELDTEHFIAVAFGGALLGAGLSLILRFGGCIDGSEIFANIVVTKLSEKTGNSYNMTPLLVGFNACVYIAAFLCISQNAALMSFLVYIVASSIIENVTDHFESIKQVTIITGDPGGIMEDIQTEMHKTCTVMESYGMIAGENNTIICYVNYFELQKLKDILAKYNAFSTISTIDEIIR